MGRLWEGSHRAVKELQCPEQVSMAHLCPNPRFVGLVPNSSLFHVRALVGSGPEGQPQRWELPCVKQQISAEVPVLQLWVK